MGSTLFLAAGMPLVGLSPTGWVLFCVFVAYGLADAVTDVSMNAAGVEAQRRRGRTVLNSMHGIWSVGAVTAGLVASAAAELRVPLAIHLGTVAAACAVLALLVGRWVPQVSGEAPGAAGLGFTAFTTAMVLARLVADKVVDRVGPVWVVRIGGLVGGLALAAALTVGGTIPGIVAFALVGLGSAAVFPAMITAAGAMPGQAVQAMNMSTRAGFLAAPPVIGLVADGAGLPLALGLLVVPAALGLSLSAGAVRLNR